MSPAGTPLRVVLVYAGFAGLWILLSDQAAGWLFPDPGRLVLVSTLKGWLFVAVTSLILYALIARLLRDSLESSRRELAAQTERARASGLLGAIADNSSDAIFAKDLDGRYLLFNRAAAEFVGKPAGEVVGHDDTALFPPRQAVLIRDNDLAVIRQGEIKTYEEALTTAQGECHFLATKGPLRDGEGRVIGMFGISRDITAIKQTEDRLKRANRALLCLGTSNELLARATDEQAMLHDLCRMVVELGGYRMAWAGKASDDAERSVSPIAHAGTVGGYLDSIRISWADDEHGQGPTGTAIRERRAVIARDIMNDPDFEPWRAEALARGYASSLALPLLDNDGGCTRVLNIYATEPDAFDADELRFLVELASNIAHGIRALHDRGARSAAEEALRESEARFRAIIESAPVAISVADDQQNLSFVNPKFVETFGYTLADIPTLDDWWPRAYPDPAYRQRVVDAWREAYPRTQQHRIEREPVEYEVTCKDGTVRGIAFHMAPMGSSSLFYMVDITERKKGDRRIRTQVEELLRWQSLTVGREERMLELKAEVNQLLAEHGLPARYTGGSGK